MSAGHVTVWFSKSDAEVAFGELAFTGYRFLGSAERFDLFVFECFLEISGSVSAVTIHRRTRPFSVM